MEVQPGVGNSAVVISDKESAFLVHSLCSQFVTRCWIFKVKDEQRGMK